MMAEGEPNSVAESIEFLRGTNLFAAQRQSVTIVLAEIERLRLCSEIDCALGVTWKRERDEALAEIERLKWELASRCD